MKASLEDVADLEMDRGMGRDRDRLAGTDVALGALALVLDLQGAKAGEANGMPGG